MKRFNTTYYERHRDKVKAYYQKTKADRIAYAKAYYQAHREEILNKKHSYRLSRLEQTKRYNHEYYLKFTKIKRQLAKKV